MSTNFDRSYQWISSMNDNNHHLIQWYNVEITRIERRNATAFTASTKHNEIKRCAEKLTSTNKQTNKQTNIDDDGIDARTIT
jgi:hypothetical protein